MGGRYYFLLTSLPELPELGGPPPMDLAALRARAEGYGDAPAILDAIYLERDLLAREAALAGEAEPSEALVLTIGQARGEEPLPEALAAPEDAPYRVRVDATWEACFRHVAAEGRRRGCRFLVDWAGFEAALRNALVIRRSQVLQLDPTGYLVAEDLAAEDPRVEQAVSAWASAGDALAAQRALDQARWLWCDEHARYFSFAIDELAAYARKLVLATRWHEMARRAGPENAEVA